MTTYKAVIVTKNSVDKKYPLSESSIMQNTVQLLTDYRPLTLQEQEYRARMIAFLTEHGDDAFKRELLIGHMTASAFILNQEQTHFLLMHHKKLNKWLQPGGHCDGNTNVLEVALKEAREESGIAHLAPLTDDIFDIDIHEIPEYKGIPAHLHYDIRFLLTTVDTDQFVQNEESHELRWFSFDEPLPTTEESVLRMIRKLQA